MMIRKNSLSETNTTFITQDKSGQLHAARIPAFYSLLAKERKAVIKAVFTALDDSSKTSFCAIVMTSHTIHAATLGGSLVYLAVKNKNQELIYFGKINTSLYSLEEEDEQHEDEKSVVAEEKFNFGQYSHSQLASEKNLVNLCDIHGHTIGHVESIQTTFPAIYTVELNLPEGAEAMLLHDQSGLLGTFSFDKIAVMLNDPRQLADKLNKSAIAMRAPKMSEKKVCVMLSTLDRDQPPKYLFYAENAALIDKFEAIMHQAIRTAFDASKTARQKFALESLVIQSNQYLLEELERQLVTFTSKYATYQVKIRRLLKRMEFFRQEKTEFDIGAFNAEINKLIFSLYLKVYASSRKSGSLFSLYRSALSDRELARSLEEILLYRFPEIDAVQLHKTINRGNITNRILWFAGENYPEFVKATLQTLQHIHQQPASDPEHKKSHTNAGKLLSRLGSEGMAESARLFNSKENSRVKKSAIKQFYADNIESRNRLK
jgi:hypothetical protein